MKKSLMWLRGLSIVQKALVAFGALVLIGAANSGNAPSARDLNIQKTSQTSQAQSQHRPVITTKTVTETEVIPYASTTVNDATLAKGTSKVTTAGVDGTKSNTYKITYSDGNQTKKDLVSSTTTTQAVTQVTSIGTYEAPAAPSCSNGTYVNSAGNTVCSPYASSSTPAGATAQCVDGTYSFSQSRSGTCSHHGGVATWL